MGKGEGEGVNVRDKVEGVCSVILACRRCYGLSEEPPTPMPPHPPPHTYIHTYTFIHFQFHQGPPPPLSLPHYSPNFPCHHLLSKQTLPSSPSHPLWLFAPPHSPPWPFHLIIFHTCYLNPNLAALPLRLKILSMLSVFPPDTNAWCCYPLPSSIL